MAENDSNIIRPVQGLHSLTSTKRREEGRKRNKQHHGDSDEQHPSEPDEQNIINEQVVEDNGDVHSIDYRA
ncbi:MAG: hypothetical protein ACYTBP_02080 [Planctomycetota bacterium]|jgi:hypothetical protein